METFETPPESPQKGKTLARSSLAIEDPAKPPQKQLVESRKVAISNRRKDGSSRDPTGSGLHGVDVSGGKAGFVGCTEKQEDVKESGLGVHGLGFDLQSKMAEENETVDMALGGQFVKGTMNGSDKKVELESVGVKSVSRNKDAAAKLSGNVNLPFSRTEVMCDDEDAEEIGIDEGGHQFFVGDFVWGKIRSHPWWPGQVYNPSDASDYAAKYKQRDRLLVAYFGDGSFSWCYPSQLEPFVENFESMSKQSDSVLFVNAVQAALSAVGRLVESEMTCFCKQEENQLNFSRPLAANAGIKGGVFVPEGGLGKHSVAQFEPSKLIVDLKNMAKIVTANNMLEFTVLKSRLLAFYQAKGGYQLSVYCIPQTIAGLEDKDEIPSMGNGGFTDVSIDDPFEEEFLSSPAGPGYGQTKQSSLQKCLNISEDKLYQRRKQKSMAEILEEAADIGPENDGQQQMFFEERKSEKMAPASISKLVKDDGKLEIHSGNRLTSPVRRGRKKTKLLGSSILRKNQGYCAENGSSATGEKKELKKGPMSRGRKRKGSSVKNESGQTIEGTEEGTLLTEWEKNKDSGSGMDGGESGDANQENHKSLLSRKRKKSKYLSPPYTTDLKQWVEHSSSKTDSQSEFVEVSDAATGTLIGSPPIMKCSGETFKKLPSEHDDGQDAMESPSSQTRRQGEEMIIDIEQTRVSPTEVLSELKSAAIVHQDSKDTNYFDTLKGFFSVFRSSIYRDGSYYIVYHKSKRGRKRKSLHPEPGSVGKNLNQNENSSRERKIGVSGLNKKKEAKLDVSNLKRAPVASDVETDDKADGIFASSAVLFLSFPPAVSLPSKVDLIRIYRKFGALNEVETDILYNSFSGRVVFLRTADAEQAFNSSLKGSPFGAAKVSFKLRYPSAPLRIDEVNQDFHIKASSLPNKGSTALDFPSATQPSAKDTSQLNFIKQKLEMVTSILGSSDGNMSPEMIRNLHGEMKGVLEKVSAMAK